MGSKNIQDIPKNDILVALALSDRHSNYKCIVW